jgi:hypothetical protein
MTPNPSLVPNGTATAGEAGSSSASPNAAADGQANGEARTANGNGAEHGEGANAAATDGQDVSQLFADRRAEEMARRDRSLAEFLVMLDGYKPLVGTVSVAARKGLMGLVDTRGGDGVLSSEGGIRLLRSQTVNWNFATSLGME